MTEPEPLQQLDRTYVRYRNRKLSYFSGCDYFRLGSHPEVTKALETGLRKFGLNVAASRLTTGNHALYQELERRLGNFFEAEAALLAGNGYVTNLIVCQTLAGTFSHALIDERSHPSLGDAARFLDCPVITFQHRDISDLERVVGRCGPGAKLLVLTDGMFSHNGSAAPLDKYLRVLPRDGSLLVDDAHGAGVLGKTGKGTLEHTGTGRKRIIQTVTLSKAFGTYGGAILGTRALRQKILERSRLFIGHTPLPLPLANAALKAVQVLREDKGIRQRLTNKAARVKEALAGDVARTPGPIVSIKLAEESESKRFREALVEKRIYPPFIVYPGGSARRDTGRYQGYFRFVISSEHTGKQLDALMEVLRTVGLTADV
jgi:7-keto-8-aminopelargonate synthetase-like enzyme